MIFPFGAIAIANDLLYYHWRNCKTTELLHHPKHNSGSTPKILWCSSVTPLRTTDYKERGFKTSDAKFLFEKFGNLAIFFVSESKQYVFGMMRFCAKEPTALE